MRFSVGDKLGPYEIKAPIGKGGMGEVYLSTDTRLGRSVAIKVSSREFNDRFEREARAISALNHPHICTLYDVGPNYLVMELVEGETLSKIIERGPLPLDKALAYAIQIVDALASAHAKGVIHRDLKPGNIIITRNGAKVLDFGLARLKSERFSSESADHIETVTEPITRAGAVLGTLYYMAPEQVEGKDADERSDIFSFGVVLHEMITGQRPFTGDTQAAVLAAVLKDQAPPMSQRQPATPRALERLVRKCLEKNPDDRWQSARDLKPALELIDLDAPPASTSSSSVPIPAQAGHKNKWVWPALAAAALLALVAAAYTFWPKTQPPARVTRFEIALPPDVQITSGDFYLRLSPDGTKLAFTSSGGKAGIWIRDLESVQARVLAGTEGAIAPFWSPDSKSLAYGLGKRLMRVDIGGGPPQVLCESGFQYQVGTGFWTADGEIVFGPRGAGTLQKVSAAGGVPTPVVALKGDEAGAALPSLLPDGRHFLYSLATSTKRGVFFGSLDNKPDQQPRQQVAQAQLGVTFARASNAAGGVLFFVRDGALMAQPFDPKALRLAGDPVPVVPQIGTGPSHAHFSVTSSGVMAYRTGAGSNLQVAWLDRQGTTSQKIGEPGNIGSLSLSPDESQIALFRSDTNVRVGGAAAQGDIWLLDVARNVEQRLTTGQNVQVSVGNGPVWSPNGKQLAYASGSRIYVKDVGGASDAKLIKDVGQTALVSDWTRDGRFLIDSQLGARGSHIFAVPVQGGDPAPVVVTEAAEDIATVSPDARWIAYGSNQSGRSEVYVRPFTAPGSGTASLGPVIQISAEGGAYPKWRADGKELFFVGNNGSLMAAEIETFNGAFRPAAPVPLGIRLVAGGWSPNKTGQKFLLARPLDQGAQTPITVVTNWEAALKRQ